MKKAALTIAGSDPSGGAGLQADLKVFHQFGVYGMSVVTLITVQNTLGVQAVKLLDPKLVLEQMDAVVGDIPPGAAKTGALGGAEIIEAVADRARSFGFPLVVDPVLISKHGHPLLEEDAVDVLSRKLLPRAFLVTPNRWEAEALSGIAVNDYTSAAVAATDIAKRGAGAVVVKGLRIENRAIDVLWAGGEALPIESPWIDTGSTHGTGCTFSAAVTAELSRGTALEVAVRRAKSYVTSALRNAPGLGSGIGPVDHHASRGGRDDSSRTTGPQG